MLALTPRPVSSSLEELLADVVRREPFPVNDSKSGSAFERLTTTDGSVRILKHVHVDDDWTMRFNGDVGCNPLQVWASGLMDVLPERIDHGVVGAATGVGRDALGAAILMRDLSREVRPGEDVVALEEHLSYIDDMATLSARTLGWRDDVGLVPIGNRWTWFNEVSLGVEAARGWPHPVPKIALEGWGRFAQRAPADVRAVIDDLRRDPSPLVVKVQGTPQSFLHGDWKLANLGTGTDGRTVLIDWSYTGEGPCTYDLAWYLAVNRARMPQSKEDTIARFRSSLVREVVDVDRWFDEQLALSLLAALVVFGWEKALDDGAELAWWCDRVREGAARL